MQHILQGLLRVQVGSVVGSLLKGITWLFVPALGVAQIVDRSDARSVQNLLESLTEHWGWALFIAVATVWVAADPGGQLLRYVNRIRTAGHRANLEEEALVRLWRERQKRSMRFQDIQELVLQAAEQELEEALDMRDQLKTNLLIVSPPDEIKVEARSKPGSPQQAVYPVDRSMPAWLAMERNQTVVRSGMTPTNRPYRSVAATPIAADKKAFGALTADTPRERAFKGKEAIIDRVLRPYCALLLLTLPKDSKHQPCPHRYNR